MIISMAICKLFVENACASIFLNLYDAMASHSSVLLYPCLYACVICVYNPAGIVTARTHIHFLLAALKVAVAGVRPERGGEAQADGRGELALFVPGILLRSGAAAAHTSRW